SVTCSARRARAGADGHPSFSGGQCPWPTGAEIVGRLSARCGGGRGGIGTLQRRRRGDLARRSFAAAAPGFGSRAWRSPCPARRPRVRLRAFRQRAHSPDPLCCTGSVQPAWRRTA
ncbi:hypothetical protein LEMLEM_LOCUS11312, partial [Lemmus lemmus]